MAIFSELPGGVEFYNMVEHVRQRRHGIRLLLSIRAEISARDFIVGHHEVFKAEIKLRDRCSDFVIRSLQRGNLHFHSSTKVTAFQLLQL